jgi:hypothetical protein
MLIHRGLGTKADVENQPSTDAAPAADNTRGPTWRPASPDDKPPQKLIEAKLAHDRQQMERALDHLQVHDPALRRQMREAMLDKRIYDARRREEACRGDEPPTNALECGLNQGWELYRRAYADSEFQRKNDMLKPFRDYLLAGEAFKVGSREPLDALRGEAPNTTNAADPADAIVQAVLKFCVKKLTIGGRKNGGFSVTEAARRVADHATDQGLPRTRSTVRKINYDRTNKKAAEWYSLIAAGGLQDGDRCRSQDERLAWLQQVTVFTGLAKSYPIRIPE